MSIKPFIVGLAGTAVSSEEVVFLEAERPVGLILFARNIDQPEQVRRLTDAFRRATDNPDALVLIDQEGGRVARLGPPHWRKAPAMARFGEIFDQDPAAAREALALNARLLAADLVALGINVDCLPVLDVPQPGADPIISDRAFHRDPHVIADLGQVCMNALAAGGVLPVVKHIPGHGRARVDSHLTLPVVDADLSDLEQTDFLPFRELAHAPFAMTAHIVFTALDQTRCATLSPTVINYVRTALGFKGIIMTDDLSMGALTASMKSRARNALAAGCDLLLHCNGDLEEMRAIADVCSPADKALLEKITQVQQQLPSDDHFAEKTATDRLNELLAQ